MRIVMWGIDHRSAPLELRERLALSDDAAADLLADLRRRYPLCEAVVLSTCHRTELYLARPTHEPPSRADIEQWLAAARGVAAPALAAASRAREQEQALLHLMRLAAGLESMVLGEPQILGQVRRAYERAAAGHAVGPVLHRAFQQALNAGRTARAETGIDQGRLSIGSVAVDFARQIFETFEGKTVLGIGAGEMAKLALRHLLALRPGRLYLVNRSADRARLLVQRLGLDPQRAAVREWEQLDDLLLEADIVVSSTASPQPILTVARFQPLLQRRRRGPLFLIDIAMPRDVDPAVARLPNVYLYNIDDLQAVAARAQRRRDDQVSRCDEILRQAAQRCLRELQSRELGRLIRALRQRLHELGDVELERTCRRLRAAAPAMAPEELGRLVGEHTRRLINKILHLPLSRLDGGQDHVALHAAALRRLFALNDDLPAATPRPSEPAPPRAPADPVARPPD